MIDRVFVELGAWNWMVLGCILLALEIVLPGFFLLWIGLAAIVTGAVSLLLWDSAWWGWEAQTLVFLMLALISAWIGSKVLSRSRSDPDADLLNQRSAQMIGKLATLTEPIKDGRGRVRIGDTLWRVSGPDLPVGTQVRVKAAAATELELVVEPV
jgi:membrane protein implicated in regulation of membrane protease activity